MGRGYIAVYVLLAGILAFTRQNPCPPLQIGYTYAQIKEHCPDIGIQAVFKLDENRPVYFCPSQRLLVVGDIRTGKTVGILLYDGPLN
jgi:hypothetical protein